MIVKRACDPIPSLIAWVLIRVGKVPSSTIIPVIIIPVIIIPVRSISGVV
jgi:hypothetical protein